MYNTLFSPTVVLNLGLMGIPQKTSEQDEVVHQTTV